MICYESNETQKMNTKTDHWHLFGLAGLVVRRCTPTRTVLNLDGATVALVPLAVLLTHSSDNRRTDAMIPHTLEPFKANA